MNSTSLSLPSSQSQFPQQQQSQPLYSNHQQQAQHRHINLHAHKASPMGQQQNLEQIREETVMESYMDGMESGEYFAQLQLQSPQLPQANFSMPSSQQQHSGQLTTPMMTPSSLTTQFDFSTASSLTVSTPLLASQSQAGFDMSGVTTPTVSSTTLLPASMEGSSNYGYHAFSPTINPLFSSPPAISSTGAFSPSMTGYFTHPQPHQQHQHQHQQQHQQQQQQQHQQSGHLHQYFSNNIISPVSGVLQSVSHGTSDTQMTQDDGNMFMTNSGMSVWDSYSMTNPTPSVEVLMQQQQQEQQQLQMSGDLSNQAQQQQVYQQQDQLSPALNAVGGMGGYTVTTPPMTPHRHHRLFHSQSQPGLRNLQQEQQKQQLFHQHQHQQQQSLRRRQHSVHFPNEFLSGDLGSMRATRHVSLSVGSYSAPIPSLASLSEMMQDSPSGMAAAVMLGGADAATTLAETATLLSMSLPTSTRGFSFLDGPPPPMPHQHHQFLPTSPPLTSSTDLPTASSTPTTPKSRSRAGSKSRSRPTSASSIVSVRNASAPYSPNTTPVATGGVANSRSPSLVPLSPIPPFKHGSATDSELVVGGPPTPAYEAGLIIIPGTPGATAAANTAAVGGTGAATGPPTSTGGKAKRISRIKVPGKSRSRSSTITSQTSVLGTPSESTANLPNSPFSLVLSEQDEKTLQGLAEQAAGDGRTITAATTPREDIDPFQLDPAVQMHQQQQYQQQNPSMFDMSLMEDLEDDEDVEGIDVDGADPDESSGITTTAGAAGASSSSTSSSSSSSSPAPGKPIPCPIPSCPKSFTRPFNLNAHVKSHDTLKPYGCHLCSRVFSRKHDLQRHIRVHTGSKPYVCVNCQKAFARTDALCRHYKVEEPCKVFMQQDEVRKQAQQQVQAQLHQEQIELQQAQEAHAQAQAQAQVEAQAHMMLQPDEVDSSEKLTAMSMSVTMEQVQRHQHQQQLKQEHQQLDAETMPSVAANNHEQDHAQS